MRSRVQHPRGFSGPTRFGIVVAIGLLVVGIAYLSGVFGSTRLGISLNNNPNLERGLVAHFTFDGDSFDASGDSRAFTSRVGGYVAYATGTVSREASTTLSFDVSANSYTESWAGIHDTANDILYMGVGYGSNDRDAFYCQPTVSGDGDGYCEEGEWSLAHNSSDTGRISTFGYDRHNGVLYIGGPFDTSIAEYHCEPNADGNADGICEPGEWTAGFSVAGLRTQEDILHDPVNSVMYLATGFDPGSDGEVWYCEPNVDGDADGVCESAEWTKTADEGSNFVNDLYFDTQNLVLYFAGGGNTSVPEGDMYYCKPGVSGDGDGICESSEWTMSSTTNSEPQYAVYAFTQDTDNSVLYSSIDEDVWYCQPQSDGDGDGICEDGEWTKNTSFATTGQKSLFYDDVHKLLYLGFNNDGSSYDGQVWTCAPNTAGDADGICEGTSEWELLHDSAITQQEGFLKDTVRDVLYWGGNDDLYFGFGTSSIDAFSNEDLVPGAIGQGVSFDGSVDYLDLGANFGYQPDETFSVAAWVRSDTSGVYQTVASRRNAGDNAGWALAYTDNDRLEFLIGDSGSTKYGARTGVLDIQGEWVHVVASYDGSEANTGITLFVNGVDATALYDDNDSGATITYSDNAKIGSSRDTSFFNGTIDDVRIWDTEITGDIAQRLYALGNTTRVSKTITTNSDLENGLIGHWTFDGKDVDLAASAAEIKDRSPNANHGDWLSHATTTVPGVMGQALYFPGATSYVVASGLASYDTLPLTLSQWLYIDPTADTSSNRYSLRMAHSSSPWYAYRIYADSNELRCGFVSSGGSESTCLADAGYKKGQWYHVLCTIDASGNGNIFIDGVQQADTCNPGSLYNADSTLRIGGNNGSINDWQGYIDDVRIYNRALSAEEVQRLYQLGR
jgi:hypothetical protein